MESKRIRDVAVCGRRGADPAAAFLHRLTEKRDLSGTMFLVDGDGSLTALSSRSGQFDDADRYRIEKWFHRLKTRVYRFQNS